MTALLAVGPLCSENNEYMVNQGRDMVGLGYSRLESVKESILVGRVCQ